MTDLMDDLVRARLEPIRDALWEHGEITATGLVRLDKAIGVETYEKDSYEENKEGSPASGG